MVFTPSQSGTNKKHLQANEHGTQTVTGLLDWSADRRGWARKERVRDLCVCMCECLHGDLSLLCVRMGVLYWLPCQHHRMLIGWELVPGHRSWRCLCILLIQTVSTADVCVRVRGCECECVRVCFCIKTVGSQRKKTEQKLLFISSF